MARGTPTYFENQVTGTSVRNDFYTALRSQLGSFLSSGTAAWEEYDVINGTTGSRDIVFRSIGDRTLASGAGDAGLFVRLIENGTVQIDLKVYQDWSTLDGAGAREAFSATYLTWAMSNTTDLDYWGAMNEYEFCLIARQGANFRILHFGSPQRLHVPSDGRGVGFTTASATAGSSVVLSVDRDLTSSLQVGQKIWIYNQTAAGNTLEDATVEIVEVEAVTTNTVTIDTLSSNKASGAIIGLDPSPCIGTFYLSPSQTIVYMPNGADGSTTSGGHGYSYAALGTELTESNLDPNANGLYYGWQAVIVTSTAIIGAPRGVPELVTFWAEGAQSDADRMLTDYAGSASGAWKVFPTMVGVPSSAATAVGPGATA